MMHAKGHNGSIAFDGRTITICRSSWLARQIFRADEKTIPLRAVSGVQWKEPNHVFNGHMGFTTPGGDEPGVATVVPNLRNRNTVVFTRPQRDDFAALKDAIDAALEIVR